MHHRNQKRKARRRARVALARGRAIFDLYAPGLSDKYDRDGRPIGLRRWCELMQVPSYRQIARSSVRGVDVSTVWLGLGCPFGHGPIRIFETMIFYGGSPVLGWQERHSTLDEARRGHAAAIAAVYALTAEELKENRL